MSYSIIIPIYNEIRTLKVLLCSLEIYYSKGNEILIVDDGSNDGSDKILKKNSFITLLTLKKNYGKGVALKTGLFYSKYDKILIYDGDLELETKDISKLMILDRRNAIYSIMGFRFKKLHPLKSGIDWGNFIFTVFFNFLNISHHKDILCCAKSFYKKDIKIDNLKSIGFDIDIELSNYLTVNSNRKLIRQILINYNRRSIQDGKKLKISDGWIILKRIILSI